MTWPQHLAAWWIDYLAAATILLIVALIAGYLMRQPVQRMALAWSTMIALVVLAICCAVPSWPRIALVSHEAATTSPALPVPIEIQRSSLAPSSRAPTLPPLPPYVRPQQSTSPLTPRSPAEHTKAPNPPQLPTNPASLTNKIDPSSLVSNALLAGAFTVTCWLILGQLRMRRLCRRAQPAPEFAHEELRKLVASNARLPRLLVDKLLSTAAALGLRHPTILLPASALEAAPQSTPHAPREESTPPSSTTTLPLRALLAHEYAHIQHRDLWLLALGRLLLVVLFAHPLYHLLRRRIRTDQELLADAAAAQHCGRHEYAETLVAWARHQPNPSSRLNWALGIWERPSQLSRRIAMLLNERIRLRMTCSRRTRIVVASFALALAAGLSAFTFRPLQVAKAETPNSDLESSAAPQEASSTENIAFEGNTIASDARLRTIVAADRAINRDNTKVERKKAAEEAVNRLTNFYRGQGYFNAKVSRVLEFEDGDVKTVRWIINEGPRYSIRSIQFVGIKKFTQEELTNQIKIKPDESFAQDALESAKQRLLDFYGSRGYIFADVQADLKLADKKPEVDLVYQLKEGSQYRIGRIHLRTNDLDIDAGGLEIKGRLDLKPGDVIDIRKLRNLERRIKFSNTAVAGVADITISDTPKQTMKVVARIGSQVITAGDLNMLVNDTFARANRKIPKDASSTELKKSQQQVLKQIIEWKLIYNDAIKALPQERLPKIEAEISAAFDSEVLPRLLKQHRVETIEELDRKLQKDDSSLNFLRRNLLEQTVADEWLRHKTKGDSAANETKDERQARMKKERADYLDQLRESTPIWTIFDADTKVNSDPHTDQQHAESESGDSFGTRLTTSLQALLESVAVPAYAGEKIAPPNNSAASTNVTITGACRNEIGEPIADTRVRLYRFSHLGQSISRPSMRIKMMGVGAPGAEDQEQLVFDTHTGSPDSQRLVHETRSDKNGQFQFPELPADEKWESQQDELWVVVQAPSKGTEFRRPMVSKDREGKKSVRPLDVELKPAQSLRGRITDAEGKPVVGAIVISPHNQLAKPLPGMLCAVTDENGRYEINDLPAFDIDDMPAYPAGFATVQYLGVAAAVEHPDYAVGAIEYARLPAQVDHVLARPASVRGQVSIDDSGKPAEEATVTVMTQGGLVTVVKTDAEGKFAVAKLAPGKYRIEAKLPDRIPAVEEVELKPGDQPLNFRLKQGGLIKGRVVEDATGKVPDLTRGGAASIVANVVGADADPNNSCQGWVNQDGTFLVAARPGRNMVIYPHPMWEVVDADRWIKPGVEVAQGQTVEIELRIKPRFGNWEDVFAELQRAAAIANGEPAPAPAPRTERHADREWQRWFDALDNCSADALPKNPMTDEAVMRMIGKRGEFPARKETIDGQERVTAIDIHCGDENLHQLGQAIRLEQGILSRIEKFPHLKVMWLIGGPIADDWLKPLRGHQRLEELNIIYAKTMTAAGVAHLTTLPNLKSFSIVGYHIDDKALHEVGQFPKLEEFTVGGVFTDAGIAHFAEHLREHATIKSLHIGALRDSQITDETLRHLSALTGLQEFTIYNSAEIGVISPSQFTDAGLKHLAALTKLHTLKIGGEKITDAGLIHLRGLKNLKSVSLESTSVTPAGIADLKRHLPEVEVKLTKHGEEISDTAMKPAKRR